MTERQSFFGVLLGWRRFIVRISVVSALVAVIVSLLLPRWYQARATITPPDENDMGGGLLQLVNQLGSGLGTGRARSLMGRSAAVDLQIGILKSRRLRAQVVDKFDLVKVYKVKTREHAIKALGKRLVVGTSPEGFIDVTVEARDPKMAADMANAFVQFLDAYNRTTSVEDARRTSAFIRACLAENQTRMDAASTALRRFQEEQGAVELGEQTRATVEALAELEAERTRLEIQKGVLSNYAMPNQMQVQEIDAQIREIDEKARQLRDKGESPASKSTSALLPLGNLPSLALDFANLKREVLVQEKVYEFLTSQLEEARIRETRDLQTVKVLDEAVPPIRRARPRRSLIVILTGGLAFTLALGTAFAAESVLGLAPAGGLAEDVWGRRIVDFARWLRAWGGPPDRPA